MGEFLAATLEIIAVLGLNGILDGTGSGVVDTQDGTLDQLDLSGRITSQTTTAATAGASRGLSLPPCLGGGSLTASIRGSHTTGHAKSGGGIVRGLTRVDGASAVGIVVGGIGSVGFGQTVTRSRSRGRQAALVRIIERTLTGEQTMGCFFLFVFVAILPSPSIYLQIVPIRSEETHVGGDVLKAMAGILVVNG